MKSVFLFIALCYASIASAQPAREPVLMGKIPASEFSSEPYQNWYQKNYTGYTVNPAIKTLLTANLLKNIHVEAFFGSWCGDSKRELPRFVKLLDEIGFDKAKFTLIGLGGSDSLYKQSPGGEEKGKGIFRVPVFIVYKNGKEIGRINEYPSESLERDLMAILKNQQYVPNYKSFAMLNDWLNKGLLLDSNVSVRGLSTKIKPLAENEFELNSVAKLLARQGYKKEALKLFAINTNLYPASTTTVASLAEAYIEQENKKAAISLLEKHLESRPPESTKPLVDILLKAKAD